METRTSTAARRMEPSSRTRSSMAAQSFAMGIDLSRIRTRFRRLPYWKLAPGGDAVKGFASREHGATPFPDARGVRESYTRRVPRRAMARGGWTQGPSGGGGGEGPLRMLPVPPRPNPAVVRAILIVVGLLVLFFTSYFQVEPDEVGVLQRFGRYVGTSNPGPHVKFPFGIDRVTKVPVQRTLKQEFGFRTLRAAAKTEFAPPTPEVLAEAVM